MILGKVTRLLSQYLSQSSRKARWKLPTGRETAWKNVENPVRMFNRGFLSARDKMPPKLEGLRKPAGQKRHG